MAGLELDEATSLRLSRIRQANTAPELRVRVILRAMGISYRVQNCDLDGSPDIANRKRRWALFVHGCFWHAHEGCPRATVPKRNRRFWKAKFASNRRRDARVESALRRRGFKVLVVWACELDTHPSAVARRLRTLVKRAGNVPRRGAPGERSSVRIP